MVNRKCVLTLLMVVAVLIAVGAQAQVVQTPLNASKIPKFVQPLPLLGPAGLPIVNGAAGPEFLSICEFQSQILPAGTLGKNTPAPMTWVWGYEVGKNCVAAPAHSYIGPVVVAQRGTPTQLTFINQLPNADPYGIGVPNPAHVLAYTQSTDQTMHWGDPLHAEENWCSKQIATGNLPSGYCLDHYTGPIPAAVHLHGGEVPPDLDGGPDAWFTGQPDLTNGAYYRGHGYYTREVAVLPSLPDPEFPPGVLVKRWSDGLYYRNDADAWTQTTAIDRATYVYPNEQEASDIWFHDHILGMTRLNVYAGIAGAYVITDDAETNPALQNPAELIPVVIQDRMFDTTGQLFFDNVGINLEHPYWVPEFVGDTIVVNGKAWPYLNLEARKYRFLFLNGSLARSYELYLNDIDNNQFGPPMWVIGTDGGYLDTPAKVDPNVKPNDKLVIMPGERYEVVVDFTNFPNRRLQLWNTAKTPYPFGAPVDGRTTKRILEIRVGATPVAATPTAFDPATMSPRVTPIVRLAGLAATPDVRRQLTLNEVMGVGGPLEVLLNNTKWDGMYVDANGILQPRPEFLTVNHNGVPAYYSEVPWEGTTEVWEIVNITADAHPIHLHLVQFQLLERQALDNLACYDPVYRASFPTGLLMEGYGPPANYLTGVNANGVQITAPGVLGGNPDPTPCLLGLPMPPLPSEAGWKDTVVAYPDQVTRIAVRWAPTDLAAVPYTGNAATLGYPFDPNHGHGYVWHCHILDHEDNEMMRPTQVNTNGSFSGRTFTKGIDY